MHEGGKGYENRDYWHREYGENSQPKLSLMGMPFPLLQ